MFANYSRASGTVIANWEAPMTAGRPAEPIWMRPEHAALGRPAQRSRAEITTAAIAIADRDGLAAVSMRRLAAELGTGAASLYRYVQARDDLLDLMADGVAAEYRIPEPTGDWLADLVALGEQLRAILRRHSWLVALIIERPVLGPNGLSVLEYFMAVLAGHAAPVRVKLEAFAMLNGLTVNFVQHEVAGGLAAQQRVAAYIGYAVTPQRHPALAAALAQESPAPADPADSYADILGRVLTGLLGPESGDR
jgi:AcrR family transcriptional regulator